MLKTLINVLFGIGVASLTFAGNTAFSAETITHLRCFYQKTPSNLDPITDFEWAISAPGKTCSPWVFNSNQKRRINAADPKNDGHSRYIDLSKNDPAKLFRSQSNNSNDSDNSCYIVEGHWKSNLAVLANVFYSKATQDDLINECQKTFAWKGINSPVAMYAAAWNYLSFDYMVWSLDTPEEKDNEKINKIITFGDSLSDTQNMFNGTEWKLPAQSNYYIGRFSNGKVWVDYLSETLNLPLYNWSIGGSASVNQYYGIIPGVTSQVQSWIYYKQFDPNYQPKNTLFTLLIGANDLISYGRTGADIQKAVQEALETLTDNGAKNIMLVNLPDISLAPAYGYGYNTNGKAVKDGVDYYNRHLVDVVNHIKEKHSDVNLYVFDIYSLMNAYMDPKNKFGITNAKDSCLELAGDAVSNYTSIQKRRSICSDAPNKADSFLFWDLLHPTTRAHKLLAESSCEFIQQDNTFGKSLKEKHNCVLK